MYTKESLTERVEELVIRQIVHVVEAGRCINEHKQSVRKYLWKSSCGGECA